jgi:hypothetical protein
MSRKTLLTLIVASMILLAFAVSQAETIKSRVGKLDFDGGYPSKKTVERLYEATDLQRAVQAYLWAIPVTAFAQWQTQHAEVFGAEDGDVVYYASYRDKLGILAPDPTTPYVVGFYNLRASGPLVIDYPAGPTVGRILNVWQRPIAELGLTGLDRGAGGKYLVMAPGQSAGNTDEYTVVESQTYNIMHGFRVLSTDSDEIDAVRESYQAYPYISRHDPRPTRVITPNGREWSGRPPHGVAYWELVSKMLHEESVHEFDRVIVAMLGPLGIDRRQAFAPDEHQQELLEEAAVIGEATASSLSFALRKNDEGAYLGTQWRIPLLFGDYREVDPATVLDHRAARFHQTNGLSAGMMPTAPGRGHARLSTYRDKGGRWLQGEISYRLRVPADPPVDAFWAVTVYDAETRSFIASEHEIVGLDSRMDLTRNEDGSIFLYFGHKEPAEEDKKKNWIPTLKDKGWFAYILLRDPTEAFFDESWQLPDIRRTDEDDDLFGGGG